jgi:hypothetical protein
MMIGSAATSHGGSWLRSLCSLHGATGRGLKGVSRVVCVVQLRTANSEDQSGVTPDEQFESGLIPV